MGIVFSSLYLASLFLTCPDEKSFDARRKLRQVIQESIERDRGGFLKNSVARGTMQMASLYLEKQLSTARVESEFWSCFGLFHVVEVKTTPKIFPSGVMMWLGIWGCWWPLFSFECPLVDY